MHFVISLRRIRSNIWFKKKNSWRSTFLLSFEGNKFAASRGWLKRTDFCNATASHTRKTQIYPLLSAINAIHSNWILENDIISVFDTAVWFDINWIYRCSHISRDMHENPATYSCFAECCVVRTELSGGAQPLLRDREPASFGRVSWRYSPTFWRT